jgi:hypothetical protein
MSPHAMSPHGMSPHAMRSHPVTRRALLRTLPLGVGAGVGALALSACDPSSPVVEPAPPPALVDPTPTPLGEQAPLVDPDTLRLPLEMLVMIVVEPGWTAPPQQLDGVFLGHAPDGDALRFTAVDQDGTALWTARRPLGGESAALTRDSSARTVAVLADRTEAGETTLTGYRLRDAEQLWGPVPVPGPIVGPGLLVAAPDGSGRAVLDADTGETLLAETELDGGRLLAEHLGVVLHTDGAELVGRDGGSGAERWRLPLPEPLDPATAAVAGRIDTTTGLAVLVDADGAGILLDLPGGRLVAEDVTAAAHDHAMDTTVVVSGRLVRGLAADGAETWRHEDPEPLALHSAGERLAYAQRPEEGTLVVLDTAQGRLVTPYDVDRDGPLAVPELFSAEAGAAVRVESTRYLVTTALDEAYGLRG